MSKESVVAGIKALVGGLSHSQREGLAMDLAAVAAGEEVQFLRCDRNALTAWLPGKPGTSEKDRLLEIAKSGTMSKDDEARLVALLTAEKRPKRGDGPLILTEAERVELRRLGHNPDVVARVHEVHSGAEFLALKREVEGGDDAA